MEDLEELRVWEVRSVYLITTAEQTLNGSQKFAHIVKEKKRRMFCSGHVVGNCTGMVVTTFSDVYKEIKSLVSDKTTYSRRTRYCGAINTHRLLQCMELRTKGLGFL